MSSYASGQLHRRTASQPGKAFNASTILSSQATSCSLREHDLNTVRPTASSGHSSHQTFDDIQLPPPAPAAFAFPSTHYDPQAASPVEDFPGARLGHQRSLTNTFFDNCRPLVQRAASTIQQHSSKAALHSPTKSLASFISLRSNTIPEDEVSHHSSDSEQQPKRNTKLLGNLFNGASAPISLGFIPSQTPKPSPRREENDDDMFSSVPPPLHRRQTSQASTSRFSWLVNSVTGKTAADASEARGFEDSSDGLLNLDITNALFPHGPADPLAPSSFHDLQTMAEALLCRYQDAYRSQAEQLQDLRAEQNVQDEELDEYETRARHLKVQLDDMAAKATEQEREMQALKRQLDNERAHRIAAEEARLRSATIVRPEVDDHPDVPRDIERRHQRKRTSTSTSSTADSGFESDMDTASSRTSIFSHLRDSADIRALAPPSSVTLASLQDAVPQEAVLMPMKKARAVNDLVLQEVRPQQKPTLVGRREEAGAWAVVRNVREENAALQRRVAELEDVVESTTDLIASFGL